MQQKGHLDGHLSSDKTIFKTQANITVVGLKLHASLLRMAYRSPLSPILTCWLAGGLVGLLMTAYRSPLTCPLLCLPVGWLVVWWAC